MPEMMHMVFVNGSNDVVGEGHLIRLAKHNNGDIAIVEKDEGAQLRVFR